MTKGQPLQAVIAINVRSIRKRMKETQPQVADRAKARGYVLDQGTVSRIENRRLVFSIDVLEALAHGLDVEAWQLLVPSSTRRTFPFCARPPRPSANCGNAYRNMPEPSG